MKTKQILFITFALATLALGQTKAQTQVGDSQLKAPPTAFTSIKVETPTGFVRVQPDNVTFVLDLAASPPIAKCIVTGGGPTITFVDGEIPAGTINGTNRIFTLAFAPAPAVSLVLYRNGVKQRAGVDFDLAGSTITFRLVVGVPVPLTGDSLEASYRR